MSMQEMNKFESRLWQNSEIKLFASLGAVLLVFLFLSLVSDANHNRFNEVRSVANDSFMNVTLTAKSAYVYDVRTKTVLFALDENRRLPLASLTKVMSALVATELGTPTTTIVVSQEALKAEGDSGLLVGERWYLKDLLDFTLTTSSNDGIRATALALGALTPLENEKNFVSQMNAKTGELGMLNTYFYNEVGLDESEVKGGAYGSAKDITRLIEYILISHPTLLEATQEGRETISSLDMPHKAKNTNLIAEKIPGLLGSKTGFTDIAGGNLVVAFDPEIGRPIIITVLGSTEEERFNDVGMLVERTFQYINIE